MQDIIEVNRRQRKRQALHESMLSAAGELFREQGIAGTTMDDIAEAADVARQTVFNHFPYKEAFALELGAAHISAIAEQAQALLESGVPALEVVQRSGAWLLQAALQDRDVAVVVARELLHPDTDRSTRAAEHVPLERLFEALLEQAREEGSLREDLPLDVVASRLSCVLTSLVSQVANCEPTLLWRNLAVCYDMLFNGITKRSA
jgi:AcrR family transcriptional regulator